MSPTPEDFFLALRFGAAPDRAFFEAVFFREAALFFEVVFFFAPARFLGAAFFELAFFRTLFLAAAFFLRTTFFLRLPAFFRETAFFFRALFFLRTAMTVPLNSPIRQANSTSGCGGGAETHAPGSAPPCFRSARPLFPGRPAVALTPTAITLARGALLTGPLLVGCLPGARLARLPRGIL